MKKTRIIPIAILLCLSLSGCGDFFPKGKEMEKYDAATVIGIDRCESDPSRIEVTLLTKVDKSGDGGGSVTIKTLSETGPTAFEAQRNLRGKEEKVTFLGYIDYFLIGEDAAKEDFTKYFDYFVRDHETRYTPRIFVVKDGTAKELIETTSSTKIFLTDQLENIVSAADILGNSGDVRILDAVNMLNSKTGATVIPAIRSKELENQKRSGEMAEKDVAAAGFSVIKDFKLAGYFDGSSILGYNFLMNKVKSCPISIKDMNGEYTALEVVYSDTSSENKFEDGELKEVTYKVRVISTLAEQQSREKITTEEGVTDLENKQDEYISSVMSDAISTSKEFGADCFGLADKVRYQHPVKWEKIKDNWSDIYPDLTINIEVTSTIARTYDINQPIGYKGED